MGMIFEIFKVIFIIFDIMLLAVTDSTVAKILLALSISLISISLKEWW